MGKNNFVPFWSPLESKKLIPLYRGSLIQISSSLVPTIYHPTPKFTGVPNKTKWQCMHIIKSSHLFSRVCVASNKTSDLLKQNKVLSLNKTFYKGFTQETTHFFYKKPSQGPSSISFLFQIQILVLKVSQAVS